jgi:hypothetical protein
MGGKKNMNIAVIGWGSLIWDKKTLNIQGGWDTKGPILPIEFSRISRDSRVTLIIDEAARPVTTLWSMSKHKTLTDAKENLRKREDTTPRSIHSIRLTDTPTTIIQQEIQKWLPQHGLDAAMWTGLSFSNRTESRRPSLPDIIRHLHSLTGTTLLDAKEYIQKAPTQIATEYRSGIEKEFGWTPI